MKPTETKIIYTCCSRPYFNGSALLVQALRHAFNADGELRAGEKFKRTRGHRTNIGTQFDVVGVNVETIRRVSHR